MQISAIALAACTMSAHALTAPVSRKMAVIFDIDGTMSDSFQLGFGATNTVLAANDYAAQPPMASPLTSPADAHGTFAAAPTVSPLTSSVPPLTMASATIDVPTANAQGTANVRLSDMDD